MRMETESYPPMPPANSVPNYPQHPSPPLLHISECRQLI